jgi:hypothetical protein
LTENRKADEVRKRRNEAAKRALAETEERRRKRAPEPPAPREIGGRKGPDPTRHGDWEKDGIAVDF